MTDAAYCFQEDIRNRSIVKKGAIHKKNGSKSKRCTLPSDFLSAAQKRKKNGECVQMRMGEPIRDWKVFRSYPENLQAEYLNNLIDNYGARGCDLAEMFDISSPALYAVCKSYSTPVLFPRGGNRSMSESFRTFLNGTGEVVEEVQPEETDISEPEIPQKENPEKAFEFSGVSRMSFGAVGTKDEVIAMLSRVLDGTTRYRFDISFTNLENVCKEN